MDRIDANPAPVPRAYPKNPDITRMNLRFLEAFYGVAALKSISRGWFPKNVVFVTSKTFETLKPEARSAVRKAATDAEARGWAASESLANSATEELRQNGISIDRIPGDVELEIKRMGEKFSREWVRTVGNEANQIFVPYYLQ